MTPKLSFDIASPEGFLDKLKAEHRDVLDDLTNSRHAINAALTAWHMIDWVWGLRVKANATYMGQLGVRTRDALTEAILSDCPELGTMQSIATGSKHLGSDKGSANSTAVHGGAFSSGFSRGFDISRLEVALEDGSVVNFDNQLDVVVNFWSEFLKRFP